MITIRKSIDRGFADHGWLKSNHTFSFADYHDPSHMGFGVLRVINEDRIEGGMGFNTHGHRDMEIISYVIDGALVHKDSMGTETTILPGEVQRMSAGTGVRHSEFNKLKDKQSHFLQIWILPEQQGISPSYDQKSFASELKDGKLVLVGSKIGRDGSISIHQDVDLYACKSDNNGSAQLESVSGRRLWVQVVGGKVAVNGQELSSGDGAAIEGVNSLNLNWSAGSQFLFFNMP